MKHDARRKYGEHGGHQGKQRRMIKREWRVTHLDKNERRNIDGMRTKKRGYRASAGPEVGREGWGGEDHVCGSSALDSRGSHNGGDFILGRYGDTLVRYHGGLGSFFHSVFI